MTGKEQETRLLCRDLGHDTAQGRALKRCDMAAWPATRPGARPRHDAFAATIRHAQAGPSWVHCAPDSVLTQFLDSILFLSYCLDTVHEHCSQNFFKKNNNNKIK